MVTMEGDANRTSYAIYQMVPFPMTFNLFSKSHCSLTLNTPQTATDTAIVAIEGE